MRKIILSSLIVLGFSSNSFAYSSNPSEASLYSGASIVIASIAIPFVLLDDLSSSRNNTYTTNNTTMTVNEVTVLNNGNAKLNTTIKGKDTQKYEFEVPEKAIKNCDIKNGTKVEVDKNKGGYTLHANNKVIGIVPTEQNAQYFIQKKQ